MGDFRALKRRDCRPAWTASPWEKGHCESFNLKLRDELLNGEIVYGLAEAKVVIESWRRHYDSKRPHSSLGYSHGARGRPVAR